MEGNDVYGLLSGRRILRNNHADSEGDIGILVQVARPEAWPEIEFEVLRVVAAGFNYRIDCIPWFVCGFNRNDIVSVVNRNGKLFLDHLVSKSGHSTFRIRLDPNKVRDASTGDVDTEFIEFTENLAKFGCTFEIADSSLQSIDVPPHASVDARAVVTDILVVYAEAGWYEWEEGTFPIRQ